MGNAETVPCNVGISVLCRYLVFVHTPTPLRGPRGLSTLVFVQITQVPHVIVLPGSFGSEGSCHGSCSIDVVYTMLNCRDEMTVCGVAEAVKSLQKGGKQKDEAVRRYNVAALQLHAEYSP